MRTLVVLSVLLAGCSAGSSEPSAPVVPRPTPANNFTPDIGAPFTLTERPPDPVRNPFEDDPLAGGSGLQPGVAPGVEFTGRDVVQRGGMAGVVIGLYNGGDVDIRSATCEVTAMSSGTVIGRTFAEWPDGVRVYRYVPMDAYFADVGPGVADRFEWLCAVE